MSQPNPRAIKAITRRAIIVGTTGASVAAAVGVPRTALAQGSTIRIVVGFPPGGSTDRAARIVGEQLQRILGRLVIVDNRPGASGRTAAQQLVGTPVDQVTLMMANAAVMSFAPLLFNNIKYDPRRDFVPVAAVNDFDFALSVGTGLPIKEIGPLLAWMRANPDKTFVGLAAAGSLPHFFTLMLSEIAGVKISVVTYKGQAPLVTDLVGGQIPMSIDGLDSVLPYHLAGKLRVLASSGVRRSPFCPEVPTFREAGIPISAYGWNALFAPATTPRATVDELSAAVVKVMMEKEVQAKFLAADTMPAIADQVKLAGKLQAFDELWLPVIRRSGFKADS